ncbi:MAG: HAMP domain-containing sensor histidine kinase [Anaerolineaceae bacterium]|jgi:signal transduction histidine kinase
MQTTQPLKNGLTVQFLLGALLALLIGLALFYLMMQPPLQEMGLMTVLMGGTGIASVMITYLGYHSGWLNHSPRIRWTLAAGYTFAGLLAFLNVWITARMMFLNQHDLTLATILLVFATSIAVVMGLFLSETITTRIQQINAAASRVAHGQLNTRLPTTGRDEIAQLAKSFNEMVDQLDTAERKKAEVEMLRRNLVAWAGHDLRTPLTSIRAILEALADGLVEDEETRQRYFSTALADIASLSHLIDDLFEMSQIDTGGLKMNLEPGNIADLVSDSIERFSAQARQKNLRLEGHVSQGVGLVRMDEERISRVLANLIANALRHTAPGGTVRVSVERSTKDIKVSVQDTGEGIQPADLPFVFEQFYRGEKSRNRSTGGTGLGLAIAKGIVHAHGGQIGVVSKVGAGTVVWFTLP